MRRRIASSAVRSALAALAAALAVLVLMFLIPTAAHAHGDTLKVVVTGHREGRVTVDVTWENDGDAVDRAVAATVNAVSPDGVRSLGPWRLVRDPGASPAGWMTAEALPPGTWKVTVDVAFPALGHGELVVGVPVVDPVQPTGAPPSRAPTGAAPTAAVPVPVPVPVPVTPSSSPTPARTPAPATPGHTAWWTTAGVAATALAGAVVGLLIRRRRGGRR
ncbi:hypothetical protein ABZX75_21975 [Streptomyces sp. NPDC003038]|uniref:hypothetical protein n=1 Tax=unclassified Streptomyces TaxID=2593676 RepID=UPI0033BD7FA4